jgi:hypothetical protein
MPLSEGQVAPAQVAGAPREEVPSAAGGPQPIGGDPRIAFALAVGGMIILFWLLMRIRKALGVK